MIFYLASFINLFLFFIEVGGLLARPISYVNGWTFMTYNNYDSNSTLIHYSLQANIPLAIKLNIGKGKEYFINSINLNYLIKRINKRFSQANVYIKSGVGLMSTDFENDSKNELAGHLEVATDWETRRYFVSYFSKAVKSESIDNTYMQYARLGIAPYIAGYGKLHTWLMYEIKHMPEMEDSCCQAQY